MKPERAWRGVVRGECEWSDDDDDAVDAEV
jgi:hypothetical protein